MPTTFANTIDGNELYAKRAEQDKDGNQIDTTYAKLNDIPTDVVPAVTSSDDGKVLKASYSGGQGSYSWQTESGGGGSSDVVILESTNISATYATQADMLADIQAGKVIVIHVASSDKYFYYSSTYASTPYFVYLSYNTTSSGVRALGYSLGTVNSDMTFSYNNYSGDGMSPRDWITPSGAILSQYVPTGAHTNGEYIFVRDGYDLRCYKCILAYTEAGSSVAPGNDTTHWSLTDLTTVLNELRSSGGGTQVQSNWTEADSSDPSYIQNKPNLATVATSGSYNDLSNTPTIPSGEELVPAHSSSDSGKVLGVNSSGNTEWVAGGSGGLPSSTSADAGKILTVNSSGNAEWDALATTAEIQAIVV